MQKVQLPEPDDISGRTGEGSAQVLLRPGPKIGIVHHPFCLKHSAEGGNLDIESSKEGYKHPERPQRVLAILERLKEQKLLQRCEEVNEYGEAPNEAIELIHSKKYLGSVEGPAGKPGRHPAGAAGSQDRPGNLKTLRRLGCSTVASW